MFNMIIMIIQLEFWKLFLRITPSHSSKILISGTLLSSPLPSMSRFFVFSLRLAVLNNTELKFFFSLRIKHNMAKDKTGTISFYDGYAGYFLSYVV